MPDTGSDINSVNPCPHPLILGLSIFNLFKFTEQVVTPGKTKIR
jgi:hypothetical protein